MSEEKGNFLPLLYDRAEEAAGLFEGLFLAGDAKFLVSAGWLPENEFVRDRVAPGLVEWESCGAQELPEVDAIQNAQRDGFLDVPWRRRQCFVVRQCACCGEKKLVREHVRNPAADRGCFPEGKPRAHARAPK